MRRGTIVKTDYGYLAQIDAGKKPDGSRNRLTKRFERESEADDWLSEQNVLLKKGVNIRPERKTFGEILDAWMATQKATVSEGTYKKYEFNAKHLAVLKGLDPKDVDIQAHLNSLPLSPETIRGVWHIARNVLDVAWYGQLILRMPRVKLPAKETREPRVLDTEQIKALLAASKTSKYHYGLWLELGTGLRRGSLLALDWDDFDWDRHTVLANKKLVRENGAWEVKSGAKTKAGSKLYDVPPPICAKLKEYAKPGRPMFETATGSRLSLWNWSRLFRSWRKHADLAIEAHNAKNPGASIKKIGDTRFHDLRHQFAYLLQDLGVHAFTIQDMGGWSDVTMAKKYSHTNREQTKKASKKLGALIKPLLE